MTQTMPETIRSEPETYETSQQVYEATISNALEISVFAEEASGREAFYNKFGIVRTPLERACMDYTGHKGYVKDEGVQNSGSYKSRGGANAVMRAIDRNPNVAIFGITSAGNAAYGVLNAANVCGRKTRAYLTSQASLLKTSALLKAGADVVKVDGDKLEDAQTYAELDLKVLENAILLHPFDQIEVIAGQATVGLELLQDLFAQQERGEVDLQNDPVKVFVPVGGGGLLAGVACAFAWAREKGWIGGKVEVIGVQLEKCDAVRRGAKYIRSGLPISEKLFEEKEFNGRADGVAVRQPGHLTTLIAADKRFVSDIMTVNEEELADAMEVTTRVRGRRVEPAGALSQAGARKYALEHPKTEDTATEHLVTLLTGVNVDDDRFQYFMGIVNARRQREVAGETAVRLAYLAGLYELEPVNAANKKGVALMPSKGSAPMPARRTFTGGKRPDVKVWTGPVPR